MGLPPQVKVDRCIFHHTLNTIPPHFMQHLQPWPDVPPSIKVWLPLSTSWCSKNSHNSRSTLVGIKKKQPTKKRQTAFGKCVRLSYHNKASQIGWLRTRKFSLSWFWRLEIQLRHQQGHAVSENYTGIFPSLLLTSGDFLAAFGFPCLLGTLVLCLDGCLSTTCVFSMFVYKIFPPWMSVSISKFPFFLIRTLVILCWSPLT